MTNATNNESSAVIEASHLSLRYGGVTVLDDINLSIAPGSVVGLVGRNGAGKTSLRVWRPVYHSPFTVIAFAGKPLRLRSATTSISRKSSSAMGNQRTALIAVVTAPQGTTVRHLARL